jgi:hypothetical protein
VNVVQIQEEMKQLPQVELKVVHHFSDGCYARELHIPKGVALAGALHKTNHHWVLSKGKVMAKTGNVSAIYEAPYHGHTRVGDKRIILGMENSVFTTFHVTDLTDVEEIGRKILGEEL